MTDVTITIETDALIAAFLQKAGDPGFGSKPLSVAVPNVHRNLDDGPYYISLAATGQRPGTEIKISVDPGRPKSRKRSIKKDNTIADMVPFFFGQGGQA